MTSVNVNVVVITGNLTHDPELRSLQSGTSVCKLRVACNTRRKSGDEWVDKPNYFDVTVWGAQGENCARFLTRGRPVAVEGRLEWREWDTNDGQKRQAVDIVANTVQFLGGRDDGGNGRQQRSDIPVDAGDFQPGAAAPAAGPPDTDIPFLRVEPAEWVDLKATWHA